MIHPKKGFTLIEVMIVVAVMAILAMIAVAQFNKYIQRARNSSAQTLLHNLALAQFTTQTGTESSGVFISIDINDATSLPNLSLLAEVGFKPDSQIGFAALPFDDEQPGSFVLFAAHASVGSQIFVYNFLPQNGVRLYDSSALYGAIVPGQIKTYSILPASGGSWTASAGLTLDLDAANGLVVSVAP